jgi:hypothetical protein
MDYSSENPGQFSGTYIGGRSVTADSGESRILFAVPKISGSSGYVHFSSRRLLSLDYDTGDMVVSPGLGGNRGDYFNICVADYDLDGTEEVFSPLYYTGASVLSAYDPFSFTEEWSVTGDDYPAVGVACGDANGDGHADLATIWRPSIRVYDPFNQTLLWSSAPLTDIPQQVEMQDLDGDDIPEIITMSLSTITVYTQSGSGYIEKSISYPEIYAGTILVEDIDEDQEVEIVYSKTETWHSETSDIIVLNKDLEIISSYSVDGRVTSMSATGTKDNTLFIATSHGDSFSTGDKHYIKHFDLQTSSVIWRSPPLLGEVSRDSLHVVQKPGSTKKQLAIGTRDAMYITQ